MIHCKSLHVTKNAIAVKLLESRPDTFLHVPDKRRTPTHVKAEVKYVGEKYEHKADVKVGDIVYVSDLLGAMCNINNEDLRIYLSEDVLAKIT